MQYAVVYRTARSWGACRHRESDQLGGESGEWPRDGDGEHWKRLVLQSLDSRRDASLTVRHRTGLYYTTSSSQACLRPRGKDLRDLPV
jgi:hypothetical protein